MSLDSAVHISQLLLALAFLQQSIEHLRAAADEWRLFIPRIILCTLLLAGVAPAWVCLALLVNGLFILHRFAGPYNGGSDRMGLLILCCLCLVHFLPSMRWQEMVFGYLAMQLLLSYFIAGGVKIMNPDWRSGRALQYVFLFSAYPASEALRQLAERPRLLLMASWAVIVFEIFFPLVMLSQTALIIGLAIAALFHFANACLFGLNRFFWVWLAAYPSIVWLQQRIAF